MPAMNSGFGVVDGKPVVVHHEHLNLGIAVDVERPDGSRSLLVPNIKHADELDFADVLRRVRRADPQGPHQQALPRRLRRHHRLDHQPRA